MEYPLKNIFDQRDKTFFLILLFFTLTASAQQTTKISNLSSLEIKADQLNQLSIQYHSNQIVYSFLIVLIDPAGENIFLDSKYRFSGKYQKQIDLSAFKKGRYSLTIICDDEKLNKKIDIK